MPYGKICKKGKHGKHTPIVSQKQAGMFGMIAGGKTPSKHPEAAKMGVKMAKAHLREAGRRKGGIKSLPKRRRGGNAVNRAISAYVRSKRRP